MKLNMKQGFNTKRENKKTWLITGVSGGLGKALANEVIREGHFVIGTVKKQEDLKEWNKTFGENGQALLLDLSLPHTIEALVEEVVKRHEGGVDILVNNAGYGLIGFAEEASDEEVRQQMEVNFFGALKLTQLLLPYMRQKRAGHIIQISSRLGITAAPGFGLYAASKFALEGISEALAAEIAPFQVKLTIVEPGPIRTEFFGRSPVFTKKDIEKYHKEVGNVKEASKSRNGKQDGDPIKIAKAIVDITKMDQPPLRLPLTAATLQALKQKINEYQNLITDWESVAMDTKIEETFISAV